MLKHVSQCLHDVKTYKENVLAARNDAVWYRTKQEMEENNSSFRISLNGKWKCFYAENPAGTPDGFEQPDYDVSAWKEINVPGHIQMQGYDRPAYINQQYPWDGREELKILEVPEKFNPVMSYVTFFQVPETMQNEDIRISFEGVESGMAVWLNGNYIGYSEDSFTPHDFRLTPYIQKGENKLAVQVIKWTPSSWMEDQDMYRFSGIFRDVWLYSVPSVHLDDFTILQLYDDKTETGKLTLSLQPSVSSGSSFMQLYQNNKLILEDSIDHTHPVYEAEIKNAECWSAEVPALYDLVLQVKDEKGKTSEWIHQYIGFRTIDIRQKIICLNGKRIVFKGVNRHEFDCDHGRVPDGKRVEQDVILMKQNNINAVRTSHYANAHYIYDDCDTYGIMMIAENNMETHGIFDMVLRGRYTQEEALPGDREEVKALLLDRVNSTYQRYKNHPSVLIWSVGNESYGGSVIYEMSRLFHKLDPYRLVHYEGIKHDRRYNDTSDMESQMYTSAEGCAAWLQEHPDKPMLLCEYSHSMGNSTGGLHKYMELADRNPLFQGGFIWDFADQTIRTKNSHGEEYQAYGGDFGERPCDWDFSADGILTGEHKPYAKLQEVKAVYQNIHGYIDKDSIVIINHNLFLNTDAFQAELVLKKEGTVLQKKDLVIHTEPGKKSTIANPFSIPEEPGNYTETISFCLRENTAWAEKGYEIAWIQSAFTRREKEKDICLPLHVIHGDYNIGVEGKDFSILFDLTKGTMISYRKENKEWITEPFKANFWRAPTQNDEGNHMRLRLGIWREASLDQYLLNDPAYPEINETDNRFSITWKYGLPGMDDSPVEITWHVFEDSTIRMELNWKPAHAYPDLPEFGFMGRFDDSLSHLRWYGKGPEETYWDRCHAKTDLYENEISDNVQPYIVPQETGNHHDTLWAEITNSSHQGIRFWSDQKMDFSAIPYTPFQLEEAKHPYELPVSYHTVIRASLHQMGVGGDDSWGARTLEEYCLHGNKPLHFVLNWKVIA